MLGQPVVHGVVDLDSPLVGDDKLYVIQAHRPLCDRIWVRNNAFGNCLRHLGVVVGELVEPCEAFEKLEVSATTVD